MEWGRHLIDGLDRGHRKPRAHPSVRSTCQELTLSYTATARVVLWLGAA